MDREILKGSLEIILLSLLKNKDMYGYEISKEIKNITDNVLILGEGTLYPALKRLKEKNLIQDYFIETNSSKKKRKYYKITEAGLIELNLKLKDFYLISNLNKKLRQLDISSRELSELKLELLDTAEEMKKDFLNEGFSEKEANEKVINTLQIDELINSTKESYLKANLINTRILSSLFLGIYTIFILICISNTTNGGGYLSKGAYLPFKFLYNLFNSNKPLLDNVFVLDQLFILL